VIRREDLARVSPRVGVDTVADDAAERVQRGESVRIAGLGTLARAYPSLAGPAEPCVYRLTLTAAVAKATHHANPQARVVLKEWREMTSDVRHLARAIGAPVEVWAYSAAARLVGGEADRVTTVSP